MSSLLVSVVVPTYRRPDFLERCLGALVAQDLDPARYEIVVADDGPEPETQRQVMRWAASACGRPAIRYVPVTATQGPAGARNAGWREARAPVIAFTDDDTVPHPDWLLEGLRAMGHGIAAAAGRVLVPRPLGTPTDYERDIARMETAEFVTANCFVRRTALELIGGFDERFTSAWREDSDLQFSLLRAQGTIVSAPDAVVKHPVRPVGHWAQGLRDHRKIAFDALLYKKHPRLYRERIRRHPPLDYYGIVAATLLAAAGFGLGYPSVGAAATVAWLALTAAFAWRRLRGTSRSPRHVAQMIATSVAIPFVAVYWRLAGAWRYRVFFF
jgi:glycosyltransferase involved in cell wall biosynthesis